MFPNPSYVKCCAHAVGVLPLIGDALASVSLSGDVKKLKPPRTEFRLRCGDYRVFFVLRGENTIAVTGVENRGNAYR
jgi:mRNA-degrading endonuclease RelE of RelBE toxin-antitoxin system